MKITKICISFLVALCLTGCPNNENIYKNIQEFRLENNGFFVHYYLLPGTSEQKDLLIFLDGSSKQSVLGLKDKATWEKYGLPYYIRKSLPENIDLLVPEKINIIPGQDSGKNENFLINDTLKNKAALYTLLINQYLNSHTTYKHIYLMGYSEGGFVLPKIYNKLAHKENISGLILCASGGLSYYETLRIQQQSPLPFTEKYRQSLSQLEKELIRIKMRPHATDRYYFGWPYCKWADYMTYRPINDFIKVQIPILMIHGDKDLNIPIESAQYVKEAFDKTGKKNLTYHEIKNADHTFNGKCDPLIMEILAWIPSTF
ncbi:MAG: alpha/beta hydrolase [Candidatus Margulisbacteria bacterium]|nr:alpha/beta hydrolase [Candidatus Margulisiibacteriota bacterium]